MWGVVLLLFAMHLLESVDRWLVPAVLRPIKAELNLSEGQAAWLLTVLLLGLAAASVPIGYLTDRLGRPRLLATGFALWSLATVATGLARSYDQIEIARALVGVGSTTFEVVALTILMDLFPRRVRTAGTRHLLSRGPDGRGPRPECGRRAGARLQHGRRPFSRWVPRD